MSKKGGSNEAAIARQEENQRQARIRAGTNSINSTFDGQFTSDFYNQQAQNYISYATPQLTDQYNDAQKELTYSLARSGLLNSSSRADLAGELSKQYDLQAQQIADKANEYSTTAKTNVEDARANLIAALNSSGDAQQAASSAVSRAAALSETPAYSALTDLFTDFTTGIGKVAAAEKAYNYTNGAYGSSGVGLFSGSKSSVVNR